LPVGLIRTKQSPKARKLRIQYEEALYHVINRGNYRRDVFETVGAATAFVVTLMEASKLHEWHLHGYAVMRNHYHLAVGTPQANLVEGMHWLQSTFATRFNRLRQERGHLFQGRYQALLLEDAAALSRVVDYIHLNPVRAGVVPPARVAEFRWSSLRHFSQEARPKELICATWLGHHGWEDSSVGLQHYVSYLADLAEDEAAQKRLGLEKLSVGWAIGTQGWRRQVAKDHAHLALNPGLEAKELHDFKEERWRSVLEQGLSSAGKTVLDIKNDIARSRWKINLAIELRKSSAPYPWIAQALKMGKPGSVRAYLFKANNNT
jgi:putative transposase